jgi:hypothetical protein
VGWGAYGDWGIVVIIIMGDVQPQCLIGAESRVWIQGIIRTTNPADSTLLRRGQFSFISTVAGVKTSLVIINHRTINPGMKP